MHVRSRPSKSHDVYCFHSPSFSTAFASLQLNYIGGLYVLMHYKVYLLTMRHSEESLAHVRETEMRACIIGVQSYMKTFDFFWGVLLGELILQHSNNLSKTLQPPKL